MTEHDDSDNSMGTSSFEDINFDENIPIDQTQFNCVASIPLTIPTIPPILDEQDFLNINPSTLLNNAQLSLDVLRRFINKECHEFKPWPSPLMFIGSVDLKNYSEMNVTQFVGESYKRTPHNKIYLCPVTYPVCENTNDMASFVSNLADKEYCKSRYKTASFKKLSTDIC